MTTTRDDRFDFDTLHDRTAIASAKWARRTAAEKAAGVVPMSVADMEFICAPAIVDAVTKAAQFGLYGYTDADDAYREAVCGWMRRRHGWAVQPQWIVPQGGVVPAMTVAVRAYTKRGDGVLMQAPGYYPFRLAIAQNGRIPVESPLRRGADGRYRMDLDDLREKAARPDVTMMFLCNPHNPVGRVWSGDEIRAVADICRENGVLLVSDEIHGDLILGGRHLPLPVAVPEMAEHCIVLTAPSKTFNLAGLQAANAIIAGDGLRTAFADRALADGQANISYFGYHATVRAYTDPSCEAWLAALLAYVRGNIAYLTDWFAQNLPAVTVVAPEGTYLVWTDWRALGLDDPALERFVRGEAMLFLGEGTMFGSGGEGYMRFNLALPRAALEKAMDGLKNAARARGFIRG